MRNIFFITLLQFLICSSMKAQDVQQYVGSRIFWDLSTRTKVFQNGGYSRMISLQDGRLMAVCENNGIDISFSRDNGKSWSSPQKIVVNSNNVPNCVPDLCQLTDGTILVAYNPRPSTPYTDERKFGIRCKRSNDGGNTWSDEIFVNDAGSTFENGCWEPSFLELPTGELQIYFADEGPYIHSNEQQISLCRSFDKGLNWTKPQKVSYRKGFRDGMPVPILLKDSSKIVLAIEDNGWGYGDFFPTTVRCPLTSNWDNNYFIDADSPFRLKTLDFNYCPQITGGAPYLRVLPNGETVLSFQSKYNHGKTHRMWVAVGNSQAENFKALSTPFYTSIDDDVLWNSLSVIDSGTVVAVGGIGGRIEMIKGTVMKKWVAPYAHPLIDGKLTKNEGYLSPLAAQVTMGTQLGNRVTADFAYQKDSLFFFAYVSDRTVFDNSADCIRLLLDVNNIRGKQPEKGIYSIVFKRDGSYEFLEGNEGNWIRHNNSNVLLKMSQRTNYYLIEAAIPWKDLGYSEAPYGKPMAATLEVEDNKGVTSLTERVPDAILRESRTWMNFYLLKNIGSNIKNKVVINADINIRSDNDMISISSNSIMNRITIYNSNGLREQSKVISNRMATMTLNGKGFFIVQIELKNGSIQRRKIIKY